MTLFLAVLLIYGLGLSWWLALPASALWIARLVWYSYLHQYHRERTCQYQQADRLASPLTALAKAIEKHESLKRSGTG